MPWDFIESASSCSDSGEKSLRGWKAHGWIWETGTWRMTSRAATADAEVAAAESAGAVGTGGGGGVDLLMTGVPPNKAPSPRPKAGFAIRAGCLSGRGLSKNYSSSYGCPNLASRLQDAFSETRILNFVPAPSALASRHEQEKSGHSGPRASFRWWRP